MDRVAGVGTRLGERILGCVPGNPSLDGDEGRVMMETRKSRFSKEDVAAAEEEIQRCSKRIEYYITEFSVEILAQKTRDKEYVVPDYQREFTWEDRRKWRFIESVIMGLPIPFLFFWEDPVSGKLEIVDGSQRLRTLEEFIHNELELKELDKLSRLEGFLFSDLPESRQRKIKNRSIRGIVLSEHADAEARLDLFDRINTGSKVANKAEVRRGALAGPYMSLIIELSADLMFERLAPVSEKQLKEREREELVARFFAYSDGLDEYQDDVSGFIFNHVEKMNARLKKEPGLAGKYRSRFVQTMEFIDRTFPYGFKKAPKGNVTPRARFEAIAIGSSLALRKRPKLRVSADAVQSILDDHEFQQNIRSDGANVRKKLEGRLYFVRDRLLEAAT
jgi:hypothetical protein